MFGLRIGASFFKALLLAPAPPLTAHWYPSFNLRSQAHPITEDLKLTDTLMTFSSYYIVSQNPDKIWTIASQKKSRPVSLFEYKIPLYPNSAYKINSARVLLKYLGMLTKRAISATPTTTGTTGTGVNSWKWPNRIPQCKILNITLDKRTECKKHFNINYNSNSYIYKCIGKRNMSLTCLLNCSFDVKRRGPTCSALRVSKSTSMESETNLCSRSLWSKRSRATYLPFGSPCTSKK